MSRSISVKFEKLSNEEKVDLMFDLINSFYIVKTPLETALFLQDLLTANELRNLSIRLRIAKLLLSGMTHREIMDELHTSLSTITKVRAWMEEGGEGFKKVISKLPLRWKFPRKIPRGPIEYHLPQTLLTLFQYKVATSQKEKVEDFLKKIKDKESIDRGIKKFFDEYYKEKALERKSKSTRSKAK